MMSWVFLTDQQIVLMGECNINLYPTQKMDVIWKQKAYDTITFANFNDV